jgi:hypothetical protein
VTGTRPAARHRAPHRARHRHPAPPGGRSGPDARAVPAIPAGAPLWRLAPAEARLERHRDELDRDVRAERRLARRELGCLVLVAVFLLVRARYLL